MFDQKHFDKFHGMHRNPPAISNTDRGEGKSPASWCAKVAPALPSLNHGMLDHTPVNRARLKQLRDDINMPTPELCLSILAWGGMWTSNGTQLFSLENAAWLNLAQELRDGTCNRRDGYNKFADLRIKRQLPGLGPAYFTKLLYFLPPEEKIGYIMDQWLGLSINILTGQEIVKLNETIKWEWTKQGKIRHFDSLVCDYNSGDDYEIFCEKIERLSEKMGTGWTPELTELALISEGGHASKKKEWRKYVIEQRQNRLLPS